MSNCNNISNPIPPFCGFTAFTPTIPKLYWNVKSQEQRILNLFDLLNKLVCYCDTMGLQININSNDIEKLKTQLQTLKDGGLVDVYEKQIYEWVQKNMEGIIKESIKFVYFGLTDDGYFCAYIPNSWEEIAFDTGAIFGRNDYGRLILKMQTDSPNAIDNSYSFSLNNMDDLKQIISDLENVTKRSDSTFNTLFTNLNADISKGGENI